MTIAVGLLTTRGVVLAADSQLTYSNFTKSSGGKLGGASSRKGVGAFAVTGASDRYSYLATLAEILSKDFVETLNTSDKASTSQRFSDLIYEFHAKHVTPFSDLPSVELLIAYQKGEEHALWQTDRTTMHEPYGGAAVGIGQTVANELLDSLWKPGLDVATAAALAVYVVSYVKTHVEGCGLHTHVMAIEEGCHYSIKRNLVTQIEGLCRSLSEEALPDVVIRCFGEEPFAPARMTLDNIQKQMTAVIAEVRKQTPPQVIMRRAARFQASQTPTSQRFPTARKQVRPASQE